MSTDSARVHPFRSINLRQWAGVVGAPVAWFAQLQTNYALVPAACRAAPTSVLVLSSVFFLTLAVGAAWLSWAGWRAEDGTWPKGSDEGPPARRRFLAALGLLTSVLFFAVMVAQAIPTFIVPVCHR